MPRLTIAANPVLPTTAAIAPNAPIGASHRIMPRMRKTRACRFFTAAMIGAPLGPIFCSANPTRSAMNSTCSTLSPVKAEKKVVGMIPIRNSVVDFASTVEAS